jgi:outer membrane protein OmpA-like peptidoglycan-associated protein
MKASLIVFFSLLSFINFSQDSLVVYFPFDSDEVSIPKISEIRRKLINQASSVTTISGYTDSIGNYFYNQDLSLRRANNIINLLSNGNETLFSNTKVNGCGELNFEGVKGRKVVIYYNQKISFQIRNAKIGDNLKMNNLNFEPGSESLLPSSIPILHDLLDVMLEFPKLVIAIEGHICCDVNDQTNLSGSRAKVVYDFLVRNGIKSERLSHKGFGSTRPIYQLPEQNEMQQISNRRVEIRVVTKN